MATPVKETRPHAFVGFLRLTRALVVSFTRNRQGLFWTLFFPVLLMAVFGLLGNQGNFRVTLAVAGPNGPLKTAVVHAFAHSPVFQVRQAASVEAARGQVQSGKVDVALVLSAQQATDGPVRAVAYYNSSNYIASQESVGAVQLALAEVDQSLSGRPPILALTTRPVAGRKVTYLAFLVPGILALMAMQNALFGLAGAIVRWKEQGVLRRMFATPLPPGVFLSASVVTQLVVNLVTLAIVAFIGKVILHAAVLVPVLPLLLTLSLGAGAFLAIAFLVAGLAKTTESVIPIVNLISFPMMFLSGIWFPVSSLPSVLRHVVQYLPLTYLADATRSLMSNGPTLTSAVRGDLLGLAVWLLAAALVAVRTWRWE